MAVQSQAGSGAEGAKEQVQEKAQVAQEKVKEGAGTVQTRMREQLDERSTQAGEQVRSTAQALRSTSEKLREEGQDAPAKAADQLARQAERVGDYLTQSDADRMLNDVESFARRQPLAMAAIGALAGFAASRFLKASSRSRYQRSAVGSIDRPQIEAPTGRSRAATGVLPEERTGTATPEPPTPPAPATGI